MLRFTRSISIINLVRRTLDLQAVHERELPPKVHTFIILLNITVVLHLDALILE